MNVISNSREIPEKITTRNRGISTSVKNLVEDNKVSTTNLISKIDDTQKDLIIQNSSYGSAVNKVFQDLEDLLTIHGDQLLAAEKKLLLSNEYKFQLVLGLNRLGEDKKISGMKLYKKIIKFIIKQLPYISHIKMDELIGKSSAKYQDLLSEINIQKNRSLEHKKQTENSKSFKEALELRELLWPIEKRLKNVRIFTNGLAEYKDILISGKQVKAGDCNTISINNKEKITNIFKKLRSDKNKLSELEKDKVIILKLEKEIVDASKKSFGLYIQHMCSLYKDTFTREEHDNFRESLTKKVHNSEQLENFRIKLFQKLVQLKIRKIKTPKKNHGVRLQKK